MRLMLAALTTLFAATSAGAGPVATWAAGPAHRVPFDQGQYKTEYLKDPGFVADGQVVGGRRYIVTSDLLALYVQPFALAKAAPKRARAPRDLAFERHALPLRLTGLASDVNNFWAPQIVRHGDRLWLFYAAGAEHGDTTRWTAYRLHLATATVADFVRQAASGGPIDFADQGPILTDAEPFGPGDQDFGVIDPALYRSPNGKAYMTYTVVRYGVPNQRYHEEFVRSREVDPADPTRALGPDRPLYDGRAKTFDDGVAEAQDLVTLDHQPWIFISVRPTDQDQRLYAAPLTPDLKPLAPGSLKPFLAPGPASGWRHSVGSSATAVIEGTPYQIFQGTDSAERFSLSWTALTRR